MTWFSEDRRSWSQKVFGEILKNGPLPKHVAIIMDGNRRYAKSRNIKKIEGHISGFEKLVEVCKLLFFRYILIKNRILIKILKQGVELVLLYGY
jgi:undecaprenyl pyrophosphate synthase